MIVSVSCRPPSAELVLSLMSWHVHTVCSCTNGVSTAMIIFHLMPPPWVWLQGSILVTFHSLFGDLTLVSQKVMWQEGDSWSVANPWLAMPFKKEQARTLHACIAIVWLYAMHVHHSMQCMCTTACNKRKLDVHRQVIRCLHDVQVKFCSAEHTTKVNWSQETSSVMPAADCVNHPIIHESLEHVLPCGSASSLSSSIASLMWSVRASLSQSNKLAASCSCIMSTNCHVISEDSGYLCMVACQFVCISDNQNEKRSGGSHMKRLVVPSWSKVWP